MKKNEIMTSSVIVVKDRRFAHHLEGMFHLENPKRLSAFESILQNPSLEARWRQVCPRMATTQELAWIHTPEYIGKVAQTSGKPFSSFDFDTQATAGSYDTAKLAVGAVFSLIDELQSGRAKRGFAFVRPPGHHAEPDQAMGFCLFNNVALGAAYLKNRYAVSRVMIVDIDAHHGNGIQNAFYHTDDVLYLSMHLFPGFPGTGNVGDVGRAKGIGHTVNVPLAKGHGDKAFAQILNYLALPIARQYQPEIILVPCGFDLYLHDRMGGMRVTPEGYAILTHLLIEMAETACNGRIVFIAEGGYSMKGIRECGLRVMQEICGVETLGQNKIDKVKNNRPSWFPSLKKALEVQREYWPVLR